jgi:hypothetical protein
MLPQLFAFAAALAACWFGSRWIRREVNRVDGNMRRTQRMLLERVRSSPAPQFRFNPRTGHYYPVE